MAQLKKKRPGRLPRIEVVDLFCGIGGLSYGMKSAGFHILAGFDLDHTCKYAYETNTKGEFIFKDITTVTANDISPRYSKKAIRVLAGCAPCQPFSSYAFKNKNKDPNKYDLLYEFGRLVNEVEPDIITMENVPAIRTFRLKPVLQDFISTLVRDNYHVWCDVVYCPDYGIPQTRKRLVLLASKLGEISLIPKTHTSDKYVTVRDIIANLPPLNAGESDPKDPLHRCSALSSLNLTRIRATQEGGSWKSWPRELILECHKRDGGRSFGSVYGRMKWDDLSPTITTQFIGYGTGRFGHPEQDRAITLREGAILQSFPPDYQFLPSNADVPIRKIARHIGNAVPPRLGEIIGESIIRSLPKRRKKESDEYK